MPGADFLGRCAGGDDDAPERVIEIWSCNWLAVEVFDSCPLRMSSGMALHWDGIDPSEIHAVCLLQRIPRRAWPDLLEDVRYMGRAVSQALNARAERDRARS